MDRIVIDGRLTVYERTGEKEIRFCEQREIALDFVLFRVLTIAGTV